MVTAPEWGTFQKPSQTNPQVKEFEQELPGEIEDQELPEDEKPQWGNFQSPTTFQGDPDPTEDEETFDYAIRNLTANTSRLLEQGLGKIGNLEKFTKDMLADYPKASGPIPWAIRELIGQDKWETIVRGPPGKQQMFPTSNQLKERSIEATGGYTAPKTKGEEKFQEYTEDVGGLLFSNSPANTIGRNQLQRAVQVATNKLLIPAAANVTKEIVKDLGLGDEKANMAKMAVWLPLSLANNINADRYASHLMNEGRRGIPNTVQGNIPRFEQRLNDIERTLLTADPRTALARESINNLRRDIASGQTNAQSFMTMYDAVNASKRSRNLFDLSRGDRRFASRAIDQVRDAVGDEVRDFRRYNPQAIDSWQNGVTAWRTIHTSNAIRNNVEAIAKGPYAKILTGPAAALFGIGSYGLTKAPAIVSGAIGAGISAGYKVTQTAYRMYDNPVLANYYWRAVGGALNENTSVFINNYQKLNKELEKSEPVNPKSKTKK